MSRWNSLAASILASGLSGPSCSAMWTKVTPSSSLNVA